MKKWFSVLFFIFFIACSAHAEPDRIATVIPLNYLTGEKAVQALNPLLATGDRISYSNNQLIVNASENTITQIKSVLKQIDVLPAVFEISVRQDAADWLNRESTDPTIYSTHTHNTAGNSQSVQVSSGSSAFIALGSNTPVVSSVSIGWWQSGVAYERMQTKQGILIEPTAQGSLVKLKVRRMSSQRNAANQQASDQQEVDTVTVIPQDRWVNLGSAGGADLADDNAISYTAGNTFKDNSTIYIKVTTLSSPSSQP